MLNILVHYANPSDWAKSDFQTVQYEKETGQHEEFVLLPPILLYHLTLYCCKATFFFFSFCFFKQTNLA